MIITLATFRPLKAAPALSQMNVAHWFPVDAGAARRRRRHGPARSGGVPIAMSRFGERILAADGCEPLYVPTGWTRTCSVPGIRQPTGILSPDRPGHVRHRDGAR